MKIEVHHDYRLQADDPVVQLIMARLTASMAKGDEAMADMKKVAEMMSAISVQIASLTGMVNELRSELYTDEPPKTGITPTTIDEHMQPAAAEVTETSAAAPAVDTPPTTAAEPAPAAEPPVAARTTGMRWDKPQNPDLAVPSGLTTDG